MNLKIIINYMDCKFYHEEDVKEIKFLNNFVNIIGSENQLSHRIYYDDILSIGVTNKNNFTIIVKRRIF